jgi:hypothetical protein
MFVSSELTLLLFFLVLIEWKNGLDQTVKVLVIQGANSGTMSSTDISFDVEGEDGTHTFKVKSG